MKKVIIAAIVSLFLLTGILRQFQEPFSSRNINSAMGYGMSMSQQMSPENCLQVCLMNIHFRIMQVAIFSFKIVKKIIPLLILIDFFILLFIVLKSFLKTSPEKLLFPKAFIGIEDLVLRE